MIPGLHVPANGYPPDCVAVLELGTNTFRLLIASLNAGQQLFRHHLERRIVRMGSGVVTHRTIDADAITRGVRALRALATVLGNYPVTQLTAVATGAFRDAANATQALTRLAAALSSPIHVLSGQQEGGHTLAGVRAGLPGCVEHSALVVDVGGGSIEVARIARDATVSIQSLPVGVVYLKELLGGQTPRTDTDLAAARARAARAVENIDLPASSLSTFRCIGTGGSMTTLAWMALGLTRYDPEKIHGFTLTGPLVENLLSEAVRLPCESLMGRYGLERGRADLVVSGGVLTAALLRRLPVKTLRVSDYGLLEGIALAVLKAKGARR